MMLKHVLTVLLLLPLTVLAGGAPESHQPLIELLKPINSLTSNFEQTLVDINGDEIQKTSGNLTVAKPSLLRWQTSPPFEQLIIADGERVWLYDPDLEQVTTQGYTDDLAKTPAMLLIGDTAELQAAYQVFLKTDAQNIDVFTLIPKSADSLYSKITLAFKDDSPIAMTLFDSLEQQTTITFSQLIVNPTVDNSVFSFAVPEGADVIYND